MGRNSNFPPPNGGPAERRAARITWTALARGRGRGAPHSRQRSGVARIYRHDYIAWDSPTLRSRVARRRFKSEIPRYIKKVTTRSEQNATHFRIESGSLA